MAVAEVEAQAPASLQEQYFEALQVQSRAASKAQALRTKALTDLLSDSEMDELARLERRLELTAPVLERLRRDMAHEQAVVDTQAAAQHDSFIPAKLAAYDRLAQAVHELFAACAELRRTHDAQVAGLARLTKPGGALAFPLLPTGAEIVQRVLGRMPNGFGWQQALLHQGARPLTNGDMQNMQDADSGTKKMNPRMISNHLKGV